ncbi:MAG: hypothetical protein LBG62_01860 [Candidatus Methanoplasma sp.]|jgi:hypothetical protein|nr:hypothetical protein [Candidatus Methanoplasma sp.]
MERTARVWRRLSSDRSGGAGVAVAVVILVVIIAAAGWFFVLNGNHATVDIKVQSTHIVADTDVTVYVDGDRIGTWRVDKLGGVRITYDYSWSVLDGDSKIIEVKAVSTGGYLGAQGSSVTVTVHKGGTASATLLV